MDRFVPRDDDKAGAEEAAFIAPELRQGKPVMASEARQSIAIIASKTQPPIPVMASEVWQSMADVANPGVSGIDWTAPWLADWRAVGEPIARRVVTGCPQAQALTEAGLSPVAFVPQAELPDGQAYEDFIFAKGQVPTREGLHDFFNALCWMHFPLAKRQLNCIQATEIARQGVGQVRGPVRDAATVFDENALLIQPSDALWAALTEHRWQDALLGLRHDWAHTRLWVFGHAALEKLVQPYKSITVHLWRVPQTVAPSAIDAWLAQDLSADKLATKPFSPLPVLGVPGWWSANAAPAFYDDAEVFRPRRMRAQVKKPYANAEIVPSP